MHKSSSLTIGLKAANFWIKTALPPVCGLWVSGPEAINPAEINGIKMACYNC